jgi:hypothetical protein
VLIQKNTFIVKQASGFMRSFLYIDKVGIVERIFRRNGWSKYDVFIKNTHKNFAVVLFPNDQINIISRDVQGNLFLTVYDNSEPETHQLYNNTDKEDIYFDAFTDGEEIHIVYTMLNKRRSAKTIFYQKVDKELRISTIDIIGKIDYDYEQPFVIYNSEKGKIYVIYQRYKDGSHYLGYKMLDEEQKMWTKYYFIDKSSEPFTDFSLLQINDNISAVYIKREDDVDKVMCFYNADLEPRYCKIYEDKRVSSCSIFMRSDKIWCTWINGNKLYGAFRLLNDMDFSNPPYEEPIKSEITNKGVYLSNFQEEESHFLNGEQYIFNNAGPDYHALPQLYNIGDRNKNTEKSSDGYISEQVLKKMQNYIDEIREKDRIIQGLRKRLAELENTNEEAPLVLDIEQTVELIEKQVEQQLGSQVEGNEEIS